MKSKSFDSKQTGHDHAKENRSFDFVKLYKSAAETKAQIDFNEVKAAKKPKVADTEEDFSKRSRSPSKHKKKKTNETLDSSYIVAAGQGALGTMTTAPTTKPNLTSTPKNKTEKSESNVKSIMKNKSDLEMSINIPKASNSSSKPKKRNKSVSFMLEEGDDLIVKKSKSDDSTKDVKNKEKSGKKRKDKRNLLAKQGSKILSNVSHNENNESSCGAEQKSTSDSELVGVKRKVKKPRKFKPPEEVQKTDEVAGDQSADVKLKKSKKKKRKAKALQDTNVETEDEPAVKSRKKELKPETIAKGLENLNIGDNAFTLSHLLDEMTVMDKNKKKKDKKQKNNEKTTKSTNPKPEEAQDGNAESEKVKWNHRKWNKDTKGEANKPKLQNSVVVENLPINIMCSYKTVLSEHFAKFGTIAGIGVAETYPNEDPQPVFTTTIFFQDEESATKALEDDDTVLAGQGFKGRIRVRRALPPTQTTLVVRAYAELGQQALSSLFASAGRMRSIRHLVKGKKTIATAFIEFDGPDAVQRALDMAQDVKIGGKKMYVAKYELREHRKKENNADNATSTD